MRVDGRRTALAEINVTPLVDVMLVLLIIFMVTAPLLRQGIQVTLPKAATTERLTSGAGLTIALTKEHVIYFNEQPVTLKELRSRLERYAKSEPVAIEADRYAYVSKLVELWDLCREVGFHEIHIATLSE